MTYQFIANNGGRNHCYRFFEDLMLCVKEEGIHRQTYKCSNPREDYYECINNYKKDAKLSIIQNRKKQLIKEGKWPPKVE